MKQSVNLSQFRQAFTDAGRANQFSYEALGMIFGYFEEIENDTGEEIELDVIAICCDYVEMSEEEIKDDYEIDSTDDDAILEFLEDHT